MVEWIEFGEGYVLGALPSDVGAAYASWIAAKPDKAGREIRGKGWWQGWESNPRHADFQSVRLALLLGYF